MLAVLHAYWGLGAHWPASQRRERLAKAAVGTPGSRAMPAIASCFVVAALLAGVASWPLFAAGMLPEAWPRWLTLLAGAGIVAVFVGTRGCRLHVGVAAALQRASRSPRSTVRYLRAAVPCARRGLHRPAHHGSQHMTKSPNGPLRVGIGGPVGSGKTALMEALCKAFRDRYDICAITNDIYTKEDALILTRAGALPEERIMGVETGGCPHTAIREDASINLAAITQMRAQVSGPRPDPDRVGRRQPRRHLQPRAGRPHHLRDRRGAGREDPAQGRPRHHALGPARHQQDRPRPARRRLARGDGEATRRRMRGERPFVFTNLKTGEGAAEVSRFVEGQGGLA